MSSYPYIPLHIFGSPCKIIVNDETIYARYIGDSDITITRDKIILVCTPCNSIRHIAQSQVIFNLDIDELKTLHKYEDDAISKHYWYHKGMSNSEIHAIASISADDIIPLSSAIC